MNINLLVALTTVPGVLLCFSNEQAARLRRKSALWAIVYTILFTTGALAGGMLLYILLFDNGNLLAAQLLGLVFMALGGALSWVLARRGAVQPSSPPSLPPYLLPIGETDEDGNPLGVPARLTPPPSDELAEPCTITLVRDKHFFSCLIPVDFNLNGEEALILRNGGSGTFITTRRYNALTVATGGGARADPYVFTAESGGEMELHARPDTRLALLNMDGRKQYWRYTTHG